MTIVQPQSLPSYVYKRDLDIKGACIYGMIVNENEEVILVYFNKRDGLLVFDGHDNYKYRINTKHQSLDIALIPGKKLRYSDIL